jgi:hypothetical protein
MFHFAWGDVKGFDAISEDQDMDIFRLTARWYERGAVVEKVFEFQCEDANKLKNSVAVARNQALVASLQIATPALSDSLKFASYLTW